MHQAHTSRHNDSRDTLYAHFLAPLVHSPRLDEMRTRLEARPAQALRIRQVHLYRPQVGLRLRPRGRCIVVVCGASASGSSKVASGWRTCRDQRRELEGPPKLRSLPDPPSNPVEDPALAVRPTRFLAVHLAPEGGVVRVRAGVAAPADLEGLREVSSVCKRHIPKEYALCRPRWGCSRRPFCRRLMFRPDTQAAHGPRAGF